MSRVVPGCHTLQLEVAMLLAQRDIGGNLAFAAVLLGVIALITVRGARRNPNGRSPLWWGTFVAATAVLLAVGAAPIQWLFTPRMLWRWDDFLSDLPSFLAIGMCGGVPAGVIVWGAIAIADRFRSPAPFQLHDGGGTADGPDQRPQESRPQQPSITPLKSRS